jgi:hypothetical protein
MIKTLLLAGAMVTAGVACGRLFAHRRRLFLSKTGSSLRVDRCTETYRQELLQKGWMEASNL